MALLKVIVAGRAIIATRIGGNPEVVTHDVDSRLVPADDPESLSQALLLLLNDPSRRADVGIAARRTVATRFTREHMLDETVALYQRIITNTLVKKEPRIG
jgi:glycosyltransferase involved in cell wall biosynthesis